MKDLLNFLSVRKNILEDEKKEFIRNESIFNKIKRKITKILFGYEYFKIKKDDCECEIEIDKDNKIIYFKKSKKDKQ